MGFDIEPGDTEINGVPVTSGYDGSGHDRVRFVKSLPAPGTGVPGGIARR
jgi:hypothetical protein